VQSFEQFYVTTKTVAERFDIERSTAYRVIDDPKTRVSLEEVTGKKRNKEYRTEGDIRDTLSGRPKRT